MSSDTPPMKLGLRIDVDTSRGTRLGVPALLNILERYSAKASFFFSVGPDNMGRNLFRLFRPSFLKKMVRSNAPGLYGWDIVLCGALRPGPMIGRHFGHLIRMTAQRGHEIGLHAWDHYQWQTRIDRMGQGEIRQTLEKGAEAIRAITGSYPTCSAAPAWKCTDTVLIEKERLPFVYNSDCRGTAPFFPTVAGRALKQPQIPVTLPTYDELIGRNGVTDRTYNDDLLSLFRPHAMNVLTVHAEAEGIRCRPMFETFLQKAMNRGIDVVPLGSLLKTWPPHSFSSISEASVPGREGSAAFQASSLNQNSSPFTKATP